MLVKKTKLTKVSTHHRVNVSSIFNANLCCLSIAKNIFVFLRYWFYFFLNIHFMKHFYLIYLLPCTLVRAKGTSKVPPFLSLMRLSPDDSSGGNTWTCFWFCFFCLFFAVVFCRSWGGGESVFHWHHDRKKGMESQGKFLLSNAASVCIYNCLEWDCLQTDIIFRSRRYIVLAMVKLSFFQWPPIVMFISWAMKQ